MSHPTKVFKWDVKAGSLREPQGRVTAVVSVFGNVDAQGDVVLPGAFTKSIAAWQERMTRGEFVPVVYAHKDSPDAIIGKVVDLRETAEGLEVDEQFFMHKPMARDTFGAILEGVLPRSSFAYDVRKAKANKSGGYDLAELHVLEVGSTLYAANDATRLVGVKAGRKAELDDSAWDANAAMTACSSAADYRSICAGERTEGDPDERGHWALPHHYLGKPANARGVAAARARFEQTQGLSNTDAARTHLFETHRLPVDESSSSAPAAGKGNGFVDVTLAAPEVVEAFQATLSAALGKAGREISAKNAGRLQAAHDAIHDVLGLPAHDAEAETDTAPTKAAQEPQVKADGPGSRAEMFALFPDLFEEVAT